MSQLICPSLFVLCVSPMCHSLCFNLSISVYLSQFSAFAHTKFTAPAPCRTYRFEAMLPMPTHTQLHCTCKFLPCCRPVLVSMHTTELFTGRCATAAAFLRFRCTMHRPARGVAWATFGVVCVMSVMFSPLGTTAVAMNKQEWCSEPGRHRNWRAPAPAAQLLHTSTIKNRYTYSTSKFKFGC